MINTKHLLKVAAAWISIIYAVCFVGVALFPSVRPGFMRYGLHTDIDVGRNVLTLGTFVAGLVIWNLVILLAVWLFAYLYNKFR